MPPMLSLLRSPRIRALMRPSKSLLFLVLPARSVLLARISTSSVSSQPIIGNAGIALRDSSQLDKVEQAKTRRKAYYQKNREKILARAKQKRNEARLRAFLRPTSSQRQGHKRWLDVSTVVWYLQNITKAELIVYDISSKSTLYDFWMVVEGPTMRTIRGWAETLKKMSLRYYKNTSITGEARENDDGWIVLDIGHTWIHFFTPEAKQSNISILDSFVECEVPPSKYPKLDSMLFDREIIVEDIDSQVGPRFSGSDSDRDRDDDKL